MLDLFLGIFVVETREIECAVAAIVVVDAVVVVIVVVVVIIVVVGARLASMV